MPARLIEAMFSAQFMELIAAQSAISSTSTPCCHA